MKKPKFGIVIAVGKSPMGEAYKKAVGKLPPPPPPAPSELAPKGKTPEEKDPKMLAPRGEKGKGPKGKMPVAPKSGKPSGKLGRTDKKL